MQIRRKGVIKTRAEINETKNTKTIEKITGYLRKSQRIDTLLDNTDTETKKEDIKEEIRDITTDHTDIKKIITDSKEQLYTQTFTHLGDMNKFLKKTPSTSTHPI